MQRHKVSKLQGSDFLDAAELRKQILKGYLNLYIHAVGSLHCVLRSCFAQKMENFLGGFCSAVVLCAFMLKLSLQTYIFLVTNYIKKYLRRRQRHVF